MKNIVTLCAAAYASSKGHGFWDHDKSCLHGGCHVMIPGEVHGVRKPDVECTSLFMHAHHEPLAGSSYADAPGPCACVNRDPLMKLMLIHSELSEALEEYRLGEAKHGGPLGTMIYECKSCGGERYDKPVMHCANVHAAPKPVGFMSELADVAIRVFDFAQACDESATAAVEEHASGTRGLVDMLGVVGTMDVFQQRLSEQRAKRVRTTFSRKLYFAHYLVTGTAGLFTQYGYTEPSWSWGPPSRPTYEAVGEKLGSLLESVEELALGVSGDIDQAIEIKMAYNKGREFRHGGKTC